MASALVDDLARSTSSRRSWASSSHRSWGAASVREAWSAQTDVFSRSGRREDDEEELRWAAIERLPTFDRLRKGVLKQVLDDGKVVHGEVDVTKLGLHDKKQLMDNILKVVEEDNEKFLRRLRDRTDRSVQFAESCVHMFRLLLFSLLMLRLEVSWLVHESGCFANWRLNCRVGIEVPKIEVRYEHLSIEGDVYVGSRALPTLVNATMNTIEVQFWFLL